jgi:hypothetical protein
MRANSGCLGALCRPYAHRLPAPDRIRGHADYLITGNQITEYLQVAVDCLAGLHVYPLRLVVANPDHKRVLLVARDRA